MRFSNISFNGSYKEGYIPRNSDKDLVREIQYARPFLRQIAYSMPEDKDLFVSLEKDEDEKQFINTFCIDRKKGFESNSLAKTYGTCYSVGLSYTEKVFQGIKREYPKLYPSVVGKFINRLGRIDSEITISKNLTEENANIFNQIYP